MDIWADLLFGNWVGILSLITVFGSFAVVVYILILLYRKSRAPQGNADEE